MAVELRVGRKSVGNFVDAVDDGGMVTVPEEEADLLECEIAVLPEEVHSDMAGFSDWFGATLPHERLYGNCEICGDGMKNRLGVTTGVMLGCQGGQCANSQFGGQVGICQVCVGDHSVQKSLEFSDVVCGAAGKKHSNGMREVNLLLCSLRCEDG